MTRLWESAAVLGLTPYAPKRRRLAAAAAFALGALIAVGVLELVAAVVRVG